jgi:hypothetical protein
MQTARQTTLKITPAFRREIEQIVDQRIRDVHVTREDFSELKSLVEKIAEAQGRTEQRMEELAEAQSRTEQRMEELAEAQKQTEIAVKKLAVGLDTTRSELGGLSRSVAYSLENEAYRQLPRYLHETHGIEITDRMVRFELDGEEINIFARGRKDGKDCFIVGETELKLSSVGKLRQLEKKVMLVKTRYDGHCIPLMITHFARPQVMEAARQKGILIVQSFEW